MRILIAGLGAIGQRHARNVRAIWGDTLDLLAYRSRRLPFVVTDALERDDSRNVEAELGITVFDNLDSALACRPNAVFVCTPSSRHVEIAQRAASAGCHLFIEKPVSHTLDGVERLRDTVDSKGLVALVGCQWRFHPCVQWLAGLLQTGQLGRLMSAEIDYAEHLADWHAYEDYRMSYAARAELGGGVALTQIHDYDLAWWLFGAPGTVTASGGHLSALDIDVEDTVDALLEGEVRVHVRQCFASRPPRRSLRVVGQRGTATVDLLGARASTDAHPSSTFVVENYQRNQMFIDVARHFRECLEGRERPAISLDTGMAVLRVVLAVKKAIRTSSRVEV